MGEQVCMTGAECCDGAAGVDANGYPVGTTGNAVLDTLEHRSSTPPHMRVNMAGCCAQPANAAHI